MQSFSHLLDLLSGSESGGVLPVLEGELGRFRVWAENTGAHRKGSVSLDYKLREAPEVKEMVAELLDSLDSDLQDGKCLAVSVIGELTSN
jgi:hypothetical protein